MKMRVVIQETAQITSARATSKGKTVLGIMTVIWGSIVIQQRQSAKNRKHGRTHVRTSTNATTTSAVPLVNAPTTSPSQ